MKPGGLCLSSLQLDLPPQNLRRQNPDCRARVSRRSLGWVCIPSLCPFPAPTSGPDTQSLCLSPTVSGPCGPQACFCQLKPCQEGLVGVLPAAGASPRGLSPPSSVRYRIGMSTTACTVVRAVPQETAVGDSHSLLP